MNYETLVARRDSLSVDMRRLSVRNRELEEHIHNDTQRIKSIEQQVGRDIEMARQQGLSEAINSAVNPLEMRIKQSRAAADTVIKEATEKLANVKVEADSGAAKEIKDTVGDIRRVAEQSLGKQFVKNYWEQLDRSPRKLGMDELESEAVKFKELKAAIAHLDRQSDSSFTGKVDKFVAGLSEGGDKNTNLKLAAGAAVVGTLAGVVAAPIYLGYLFYDAFKTVKSSSLCANALEQCKIVMDNIEELEDNLVKQRDERERMAIAKINEERDKDLDYLRNEIEDLQRKVAQAKSYAISSYHFDDTIMRTTADNAKRGLEAQVRQYQADIKGNQQRLDSIMEDLKELNKQIKASVDNITNQYMDFNKPGSAYNYDGEFLFDIADDKPNIIQLPLDRSPVIFYHEQDVANKFARLLLMQIRAKMSIFSQHSQLWDIKKSGLSFMSFQPDKSKLFELVTDEDSVMSKLSDANDLVQKKVKTIVRHYRTIQRYNTEMVEIESVPESYEFIFVMDPWAALQSNGIYLRAVNAGPTVGVYTFNFIAMSDFLEEGNKYKDLLDASKAFYELHENKLMSKSNDWTMNKLNKFGN